MKFFLNTVVVLVSAFIIFNVFIKNHAEADAKSSYQELLDGKAIIIDVREADEIKDGMIKGAIWIPLSKIQQSPESEIKKIKDLSQNKTLYLYCRSGNRSGKVKSILEEKNIKATNLGGFSALENESLPTQKGL